MKIEVLYFPGCPNQAPAIERLRAVLASEGVAAEVVEMEVNDAMAAESLKFLGSPTIRVDGTDVEGPFSEERSIGLICRTYVDGATREGMPPIGLIRRAVGHAKIQELSRKNADEAF